MDKFQITEVTKGLNHAGTKATEDVATIAEELDYKKLFIKMNDTNLSYISKISRQITFYNDWNNCYKSITPNSIVLLQHPFHYPQITRNKILYKLKNKKHVKFISFVHDVEELRKYRYDDYYKNEFNVMIDIADFIVVHNDVMKKWFQEKGIPENKLITLEIFDYLQNSENIGKTFSKKVIIAGNLDVEKSSYITRLNELTNINFQLYGPNFSEKLENAKNITYGGVCTPEEIITKLDGGFGLVWDGNSIDACTGDSGKYLKYNDPHKLSMYLSAGLPAIIWKEAAEAKLVEQNKVGIVVESLNDLLNKLNDLNEMSYMEMCLCANKFSKKLTHGFYTKKALEKIEENIIKDSVE